MTNQAFKIGILPNFHYFRFTGLFSLIFNKYVNLHRGVYNYSWSKWLIGDIWLTCGASSSISAVRHCWTNGWTVRHLLDKSECWTKCPNAWSEANVINILSNENVGPTWGVKQPNDVRCNKVVQQSWTVLSAFWRGLKKNDTQTICAPKTLDALWGRKGGFQM